MRGTRLDVAALTVATVLLRLPGFLADRHLTVDDGVFGASAVAMRAGGVPFREVFSSQGPLFLPLVYAADLLGARTSVAPRLVSVLAGVAIALGTYAIGRAVSDRGGALLAAGLTTVAGSVLWVTTPIAADGPALAFGVGAIALAVHWRHDVDVRRAVVLGLLAGAALSVKALIVGAIAPVALVLLAARRRWTVVAVATATAAAVHFALWLPFGPADVWDQSYAYHLDVADDRTPGANLAKVVSTLGDRDLLVVVALGLAVVALSVGRRASPPVPRREPWLRAPDVLLVAWAVATLLVLLTEHPMWRPHVSQLVPPLALLAARHRPSWPSLAVAGLVVAPYHAVHAADILAPDPYRGSSAEVVARLAELPPGALAISDDPGLVWRAGRRTPPELVDASVLRIERGGDITAPFLEEVARRPDVCAVAVWSRARWGSFDDLPDRLADAGYEVVLEDDRGRRLYVDGDC